MPLILTGTPPTATTLPAPASSPTTITLLGSVTPGSDATTFWFQYGTSTSYGFTTATQTIAGGGSATTALAIAAALNPGTFYRYRLVAQSLEGTVFGADLTARTEPTASAASSSVSTAEPGHLAYPARLGPDGTFVTVEQDTLDDVKQCVAVLLNTPLGIRPLAPAIGVEDPTFTDVDPDELAGTLRDQEPRATVTVTVNPADATGDETISVAVALATEEEDDL